MNLVYQYYITDEPYPLSLEYSCQFAAEYAEKNEAEYLFQEKSFLPDETEKYWKDGLVYHDICRLWKDPLFDNYDYILYLDCDVIALPNASNIFNLNPKHVAGWTERKPKNSIITGFHPFGSDHYRDIKKSFAEFNAPLIQSKYKEVSTRILNSGVLLWSKEARLIAREKFENWKKWYDRPEYEFWVVLDQIYLSAMFNKYELDVMELDDEWNITPSFFETGIAPEYSNFLHFSKPDNEDLVRYVKKNVLKGKK